MTRARWPEWSRSLEPDRSLSARRWPELAGPAPAATLLVPVGSCEQHGPHLPLDTDTRIAASVATEAAALLCPADPPGPAPGRGEAPVGGVASEVDGITSGGRPAPDVLVTPAVSFGSAGEHQAFPGTLSIGQQALRAVLVELGRSAGQWACRVVFVNGHGGNVAVLRAAVELLASEGRAVSCYSCALPPGAGPGEEFVRDGHAGRTETSLMLALAPELVAVELAVAGNTSPVSELLAAMRAGGVRSVSENGVLGDPAGASAEEGRAMLALLARRLADSVRAASE